MWYVEMNIVVSCTLYESNLLTCQIWFYHPSLPPLYIYSFLPTGHHNKHGPFFFLKCKNLIHVFLIGKITGILCQLTWQLGNLSMSFAKESNWVQKRQYSYLLTMSYRQQVFPLLLISGFWKPPWQFGEQFTHLLRLTVFGFAGAIMSAIYDEKKDDDGFLYVTYSGENTFGGLNEL